MFFKFYFLSKVVVQEFKYPFSGQSGYVEARI